MAGERPITIVGGGLAGLTLGIGLRQRGVPVTVWEAGRYPRHRVCGEFISGRGLDSLADLGLRDDLLKSLACEATTAGFHSIQASGRARRLPRPALCVSRHRLDEWLARRFTALGGELRAGQRWTGDCATEGLVRASGHRVQASDGQVFWLGLKTHARNVTLEADLEMHLMRGGYVGLCRLPDGAVNVCGLFRLRRGAPARRSGDRCQLLRGTPGSLLHARLALARFEEDSFCAVAGFSLIPHRAVERDECCLGDALTMIPPFTGNGMSMAFESAALALDPLAGYSRGALAWAEARATMAGACDQAFGRRLRWARRLHPLLLRPDLGRAKVAILSAVPGLWRFLFAATRC